LDRLLRLIGREAVMMETNEFSKTHRGPEAESGYFILALILSLLFVLVTWRWAAMVNPRIWTLWEDSRAAVSQQVSHSPIVRKDSGVVARLIHPGARRQQESRAMLLRMFALGLGNSPQQ
jgi:hypothetical protein